MLLIILSLIIAFILAELSHPFQNEIQPEKHPIKKIRIPISKSLRYDVLRRDKYRCRACGRDSSHGVTLEIDHIIPVAKGGGTEFSNLQTLCFDCNRGKRDS